MIDQSTNELVIDDAPNPNYTPPTFEQADLGTPAPQPQYQQPAPQPYAQPYYPQPAPYYAPAPWPCPACVVGGIAGAIIGGAFLHHGYGGYGYRGGWGGYRGWRR